MLWKAPNTSYLFFLKSFVWKICRVQGAIGRVLKWIFSGQPFKKRCDFIVTKCITDMWPNILGKYQYVWEVCSRMRVLSTQRYLKIVFLISWFGQTYIASLSHSYITRRIIQCYYICMPSVTTFSFADSDLFRIPPYKLREVSIRVSYSWFSKVVTLDLAVPLSGSFFCSDIVILFQRCNVYTGICCFQVCQVYWISSHFLCNSLGFCSQTTRPL